MIIPSLAVAAPIALRDGETLSVDGPVRIGLVGGLALAGPDLDADLRGQDLALVVLAGDAVARGRPAAYEALSLRLAGLPAVPLPGSGERRGDRGLADYAAAWEGLGVRGLPHSVPWRAFGLSAGGRTWRVVVVDADREALRERWADELFWLPKAVACDGCDDPVLIVANAAFTSAAAGAVPSEGARELHTLVRRHVDPSRIVLFAAGGTPSPELLLPGGPWGEAWLGTGRPAGEPATLFRDPPLDPAFDAALAAWFEVPADEVPSAWRADRHPVLGWWRLELDGDRLLVALRMSDGAGWRDAFALQWSPEAGWTPPP